jgi:hypothetical protein
MKLKLEQLKEITKKLSLTIGVISSLTALNINTSKETATIYFNLYNGENFISFKLKLDSVDEDFEAAVDTKAFIDLINSLTAEEVSLTTTDNILKISAGKSNYKLAMLYDEDHLWRPVPMFAENAEFSTSISADILNSIDLVNTQELSRVKEERVKGDAGKLYFLSNNGCFTSANAYGACLNSFRLDNSFELLLTKKIVKLFKLFENGLDLEFSETTVSNATQFRVMLTDETTLVTSLAPADKSIRTAMLKMVYKLREYATAIYQTQLILDTKELSTCLGRLGIAAKHSNKSKTDLKVNKLSILIEDNKITIKDEFDNSEEIDLKESSATVGKQTLNFYLEDLEPVIDLCQEETIELDTNASGIVVISFGNIKYFLTQLDSEN